MARLHFPHKNARGQGRCVEINLILGGTLPLFYGGDGEPGCMMKIVGRRSLGTVPAVFNSRQCSIDSE